jgi:hypothetical protein
MEELDFSVTCTTFVLLGVHVLRCLGFDSREYSLSCIFTVSSTATVWPACLLSLGTGELLRAWIKTAGA